VDRWLPSALPRNPLAGIRHRELPLNDNLNAGVSSREDGMALQATNAPAREAYQNGSGISQNAAALNANAPIPIHTIVMVMAFRLPAWSNRWA